MDEAAIGALTRWPVANVTDLAHLSLHLVDEEGLLLDRTRQRLYGLNACAVFIWKLLKDGKSPAEVSRSLTKQFAVSADVAASYVAGVLGQYETLAHDSGPSGRATEALQVPSLDVCRPRRSRAGVVETYWLLGSALRVRYDSAGLRTAIHPLLQHNALADGAEMTSVVDVAVKPGAGGLIVVAGDEAVGWSRTIDDAAVAVRACLTQLAVGRTGGLCVVHAGALRRNGGALLLPGEAGHGKSTLSAGLAARGFDMLCDDTALLAGEPPLVRCIPTGLCVKRGAYSVLESLYPRLPSLPEWRRPDGRRARYLMPGDDLPWAKSDAEVDVRWIVFPQYRADRDTVLLPLPRHEALARLLRGVYFLSGALDERNLEKLIAWIERIDCFELPLSSLDAATALLDRLCQ